FQSVVRLLRDKLADRIAKFWLRCVHKDQKKRPANREPGVQTKRSLSSEGRRQGISPLRCLRAKGCRCVFLSAMRRLIHCRERSSSLIACATCWALRARAASSTRFAGSKFSRTVASQRFH